MDSRRVTELLAEQSGVIARRQVLELGGRPADIERMLRRRDWVRVLPGVYVDRTGPPSWEQRAWAGVLAHWPAALGRASALGEGHEPIQLVVDEDRHVQARKGYQLRGLSRFTERVRWNASPPHQRLEDAVLDLAAEAGTDFAAIEVVAKACRSRRTTAPRLLQALALRPRVTRRAWLAALLADVRDGTCSVLEHGTSTAWRDLIRCPHPLASAQRAAEQDGCIATSTTRRGNWWSSSMGGSSTTQPDAATATSTATSMRPSTGDVRSGSGGDRCSSGLAPRLSGWGCCCSSVDGLARPSRADRPARSGDNQAVATHWVRRTHRRGPVSRSCRRRT